MFLLKNSHYKKISSVAYSMYTQFALRPFQRRST